MDRQFLARQPIPSDMGHMSEFPNPGPHQRRVHTTFFDNDIFLDCDVDLPSSSIPVSNTAATPFPELFPVDSHLNRITVGPNSHFRSVSVDSGLVENVGLGSAAEKLPAVVGPMPDHHQHSLSLDGSSLASLASVVGDSSFGVVNHRKKSVADEKLAEIALVDPKKAKRMLSNRQSAVRSRERKIQYTRELEGRLQVVEPEANFLAAEFTYLQGDTSRLTAENEQLASRLEEMDKSQMLRNALHELLREELHQLNMSVLNENLLNGEQYDVEELMNQGQDAIEIFENLLNEEQSDVEKLINQEQDAVEIFFNGGLPVCENQQLELRVPQPENNNQSQADNGRPHANFVDYNNGV